MSTWQAYGVECPCGASFSAQLADGLHAGRVPAARERILGDALHVYACPACGFTAEVQNRMLYTDFERHHFVLVLPPAEVARWARWAKLVRSNFDKNVRRAAPPMIQALADRFQVRLCFGMDALAEKLRAWDARLDDRLVEATKLSLLQGQPPVPGRRTRLLSVDRDRWCLTFRTQRAGEVAFETFEVSLDAYVEAKGRMPQQAREVPVVVTPPLCATDVLFAPVHAPVWQAERRFRIFGQPPDAERLRA